MDRKRAQQYISELDLSGVALPRLTLSSGMGGAASATSETQAVFDDAKDQSQVVGSSIFSFAKGVDEKVREAISDSALLAQLVANAGGTFEEDPKRWFKKYSEVLGNVGWVLQQGSFDDYVKKGTEAEVHKQLLEVLTVALGPSVTALALIKSTMKALEAMAPDSSWLKIFSRETQKAQISRFQIGLVEQDANADVFVSLLASDVRANKKITQVLFFKFRKEKASFTVNAQKVSINKASLTDLGPAIRAKVRAFQLSFLSGIAELELPPPPAG